MRGDGQKLWTAAFLLSIIANFFVVSILYLLMTTMALYAVERFQASDSVAGLAAGSFIVGALAGRIFAGKFLDFVGRRRLFLGALIILVIAALLYIPVNNLLLLLTIRTIHGVAFGAASTTLSASVMALIPAARRSEGTGYFAVSNTLAIAIGPFAAVLLVDAATYDVLFLVAAGCALAALIVGLFVRLPERTPTADERMHKWRMRWSDVFEPGALGIASVVFVAAIAYSGVMAFLNSYAQQNDMVVAASTFFLIYAGVALLSRFFIGRIQDRYGDNVVVYPMLLAFAIGLGLIAIASNGVVLLVAGAFLGIGFGGLLPCAQAIAITTAPLRRVGVTTSTYFIALDAGTGFGPLVLGSLIPAIGFEGMYAALAVLVLASMVLYHFVHGDKKYRQRFAA
ncbi:MFS transporter [Salinibacterium sp. ZJ450]|uniref:MFS transporter n=1 Tax=Salinibacterium sp. ZJ450 TaxID=2708338 RepID=UPI001CD6B0E1|nr:MFS transporter [Salinibacterium sp. ZJ450]